MKNGAFVNRKDPALKIKQTSLLTEIMQNKKKMAQLYAKNLH